MIYKIDVPLLTSLLLYYCSEGCFLFLPKAKKMFVFKIGNYFFLLLGTNLDLGLSVSSTTDLIFMKWIVRLLLRLHLKTI